MHNFGVFSHLKFSGENRLKLDMKFVCAFPACMGFMPNWMMSPPLEIPHQWRTAEFGTVAAATPIAAWGGFSALRGLDQEPR
jgi:hypothetical protein